MRRPNTTTRRTPLAASRLGNARACARHVHVLVQEACSHNVYRIHVPMHVNSMHGHMYVSRRSKVKRADARDHAHGRAMRPRFMTTSSRSKFRVMEFSLFEHRHMCICACTQVRISGFERHSPRLSIWGGLAGALTNQISRHRVQFCQAKGKGGQRSVWRR